MIRTLALTGALALSLSAAGAQAQPAGPNSMNAGASLPTPDYVRTAAQSDEFEIAEAKLALSHSHNPHIDAFARKMIHDHTQSTMMIKAALRHSGHMVPPPPPLSPAQHQMIDQLRAAGPAFDRTYVDQQAQAHEMALSVHQGYAQGGTDLALRHVAAKIVPVVQMHIQMIQGMQNHTG